MIKSITVFDAESGQSLKLTEKHPSYDLFICKNCDLSNIVPLLSQRCAVCGVVVIDVKRGENEISSQTA